MSASPSTRHGIAVLWPAFLAACLLEIVVFGSFDPDDFHGFGSAVHLSREAVLSIAFFVFWFVAAIAGFATWKLSREE